MKRKHDWQVKKLHYDDVEMQIISREGKRIHYRFPSMLVSLYSDDGKEWVFCKDKPLYLFKDHEKQLFLILFSCLSEEQKRKTDSVLRGWQINTIRRYINYMIDKGDFC